MRELITQMGELQDNVAALLDDPASAILEIDKKTTAKLTDGSLSMDNWGVPLAGSLIPWIDAAVEGGQRGRSEEHARADYPDGRTPGQCGGTAR